MPAKSEHPNIRTSYLLVWLVEIAIVLCICNGAAHYNPCTFLLKGCSDVRNALKSMTCKPSIPPNILATEHPRRSKRLILAWHAGGSHMLFPPGFVECVHVFVSLRRA
jgi:hypothetical protein